MLREGYRDNYKILFDDPVLENIKLYLIIGYSKNANTDNIVKVNNITDEIKELINRTKIFAIKNSENIG